jgi:organic hydroperoxide reductase OsmC/OhrA
MQPFPHRYSVEAVAEVEGDVTLDSERLTSIPSAPPVEFGGPGDRWSPETLLVAAVADCFVLTFRAIAAISKLSWLALDCRVTGTVDRVDRVSQFTEFAVRTSLRVPSGTNEDEARRLLEKAEQTCLISNSLKAQSRLEAHVEVAS